MRIISHTTIKDWKAQYPTADTGLTEWEKIAVEATWENIMAVRASFPHADAAKIASGRIVTVFNIKGNAFRLIVAIHYNTAVIYMLRFLAHAEYDKEKWKDQL